ncbi:poly(3-hydroxybutyrate) depolymerase [Photobacterium sp. WH77]|uniref:extracellular catalytic domain type 2 short-chain-length polyhydroxyalkanoate depolymerase n=1 Tax=unclassified Photobacterium TaxID=2628852 RepID=UPI001C480654|nr:MULTISPECIES: poly(3-hydroxybutyrate) depolymerase [unclassified Photobacterium]MBV7263429.1 poly(3-hydroxybutyrate) depolymerase [Photobacterium sp. WH24]MCG2838091.1 poly(3-hydroxybutyrate) depolymerase [Photobacterium sp. WH77]MCG2845709.1 poly(3-hydroxybutyrate) depolymerase [Photobacterium sp. WH80]MDO6582827.1 poly(3-hydroxybutyrate) depolymerase [Photobacterium sp. 2_MG-2023]
MLRTLLQRLLTFAMLFSASAQATNVLLPPLNAQANQTSISGLSSGGFMAAQFHVAFAESLVGAGIVAGGPWNCAGNNPFVNPLINATTTCMNPCANSLSGCSSTLFPNSGYLAELAKVTASNGRIDDTEHLRNDQVYLFSGRLDETVVTGVVDSAVTFYQKLGVPEAQIRYNNSVDAGHAFITSDPADTPCDLTQAPYINNCDIPQAMRILAHIYGPLNPPAAAPGGDLMAFDQSEFISSPHTSMDDTAYVYIPTSCRSASCKVHVAVHGCRQGIAAIGTTYIKETGYLNVADTNEIIVLFPQVKKSEFIPYNPRGCWDFWGYSTLSQPPYNYYTKDAPQMKAIKGMIDRLVSAG